MTTLPNVVVKYDKRQRRRRPEKTASLNDSKLDIIYKCNYSNYIIYGNVLRRDNHGKINTYKAY
jgi:hypothetical protein